MDLFSTIAAPEQRKPTKVGQGNGEFLARVAAMTPDQRKALKPCDHPFAHPGFVAANRAFHGGKP